MNPEVWMGTQVEDGIIAGPSSSTEPRDIRGAPADGVRTGVPLAELLPWIATGLAFALTFSKPMASLAVAWWTLPEAGHGLLLAPIAIWLAWRAGLDESSKPNRGLGLAVLIVAIFIRYASGLAAELFTMRGSMVLSLVGVTLYHYGFRQVLRWWLPFALIGLSIPLPELIIQALALPLQFKASQFGAAMLEARGVPIRVTGNVIHLPGRDLFVTEACSGLRSLTALISMAVLMSALMLRSPVTRVALLLLAIPVAILINGVRVFLTGFLVFFVGPSFGEGFMHMTEGWLLFLVSMTILGGLAWMTARLERFVVRRHNA